MKNKVALSMIKSDDGQIRGVSYSKSFTAHDERGLFVKPYSNYRRDNSFFKEHFFSFSFKGVIRGMHLQINESENERLITCVHGVIFDVLIDLRGGEEFGKISTRTLDSNGETNSVYVPRGVAHGFQALSDAGISYLSSSSYNADNDTGINPFSFNLAWPIDSFTVSNRDLELPTLNSYRDKIE